jgi:hypothetical protein
LPAWTPARLAQRRRGLPAADEVLVERLTKQGRRRFDARAAVTMMKSGAIPDTASGAECAMMEPSYGR